ncbi:low temperature requirement A protein [Streptococcus massiliensis]|uniref:Low temperature requirement A protein n=1 Tax=Streptococcus massiliensis TaxID=313439 RepID=A0A380KWC3_9STRE|nr:low temperature requirement A protein [Streptococcus massiliensis]
MVIAIIRSYPFVSYPLESILLFVGMAFLFVRYITQTHLNIDHHQVARTQPLIYTHLFLVMGLNLFTVGIEMLANQHHANLGFIFFIVGILIYYTSILLTTRYNKPLFRYDKEEISRYLLLLAAGICLLWLSKFSLLLLSAVLVVFTWTMMWLGAIFRRRAQQKQEKPD